jgi:hypothetical protein
MLFKNAMNSVIYFIKKKYYQYKDIFLRKKQLLDEQKWHKLYLEKYSQNKKIKICTYQLGFNRHYTRFFTSSALNSFNFNLVECPDQADIVVFINTIDTSVLKPNQKAILFFHEPLSYSHLYQSSIDWNKFKKENFRIISHLPSADYFLKDCVDITYYRSIPYVHFHHMASFPELLSLIHRNNRDKSICTITSGFNDIPGYRTRQKFIEAFSKINPSFDLYGRFSKTAAGISSYRGLCNIKWEMLSYYKYSLVIENSDDDYYISEKIFDALCCGTMPVYFGNKKIFEILPEKWFYYLPSLDESEITDLNEFIKTDAYKIISENQIEIINYIYDKFSFYSALNCLIKNEPLPISPIK